MLLCVLPFLVAEVHLGPGVGHVAVGQYVLAGGVFGPRQCRRGVRGRNRCGGGGSSGRRRRQRGGRVDDPAPVGDERAPSAAVSCGCGVVTTGARRCSESRWVIKGMRAPPPTVATAETLVAGTP